MLLLHAAALHAPSTLFRLLPPSALRCPYTVSSADLETLEPCGNLLKTAAVFELEVGASTNWLEQCGFGPVARQAIQTAVLQQQPLDLQASVYDVQHLLSFPALSQHSQ